MSPRELLARQRADQLKREAKLATALALLFAPAEQVILADIRDNAARFATLPVEAEWTAQQSAAVATFAAMVTRELSAVALSASSPVYAAKQIAAVTGAEHAKHIAEALGAAGLTALTDHAITAISHRTLDGKMLVQRYLELAKATAARLRIILAERATKGYTTSPLTEKLTDAVQRTTRREAIEIARTESWLSYGSAMVETYQANGEAVEGWKWTALLDKNTCIACICLDGNVFPLEQPFDPNHAGCRCSPMPCVIDGLPDVYETGREWFDRQPVGHKREMMGNAAYKLYTAGAITLDDLVQTTVQDGKTYHTVKSLHALRNEGKISLEQFRGAMKRA